MAVFRIEKNNNYTVMSNYHLRDKKLTFKAKGMLSFMLSLPDDWDYSLNGLCSVSKEGIKAVRNILKELEENYYLERKRIQNSKGCFDYDYYIYEQPYQEHLTNKPHTLNGNAVTVTRKRVCRKGHTNKY